MNRKRLIAMLLTAAMTGTMLAGCASAPAAAPAASSEPAAAPAAQAPAPAAEAAAETAELPDLEVWDVNNGFLEIAQGSETYNWYKDLIGVGIWQPYVEWNGGTTYGEQLNLRIAAGEMPDVFQPVNGMEKELAENDALLDLTDLLPEKAPHLWETIPQDVWDVVRTYDPTGQGRILMIPQVVAFPRMTGLIRQDWLDKLGLDMPASQDEFVEVLRHFKNDDPNGNGQADELPTGGRMEARWMDHLFSMYGIAMWEGNPQWDIYDGELTYSGVTQNMKDCLAWIHELYAEGLLDEETLLNDKAAWDGKIKSDRVGVYYHWAQGVHENAAAIEAADGAKAEYISLPPISAPGYEGWYTQMQVSGIMFVAKNTDDPAKIDAVMKMFDAYGNQDLWLDMYLGVPGMHSVEENGKQVRLPDDFSTQTNLILQPANYIATTDFTKYILEQIRSDEYGYAYDCSIDNLSHLNEYGKTIAGDGIPSSIYSDYPDIQSRTLYAEYASKIITGEYDIDKFDEFVEKWYAYGGEEVTQKAREWYATK